MRRRPTAFRGDLAKSARALHPYIEVPIVSVATPVKPVRGLKRAQFTPSSRLRPGALQEACRAFRPAWAGERKVKARVFGLGLGAVVLELARPWPAMLLFDRVLLQPPDRRGVFGLPTELSIVVLAAFFAAVAILTGVVATWSATAACDLGRTVTTRVRRQVGEHLHRLQLPTQTSARSGELLVRIMGDVSVMREAVFGTGLALAQRAVLVAGMAVVLVWLDPLLAVCALLPLLALAVVKDHQPGTGAGAAAFTPTQLMAGAGLMLVLFVGARRVLSGVLTPGELLVAVAYARAIAAPWHRGTTAHRPFAQATASAERVLELLGRRPEPSGIGLPPRRLEGDVAFRDVQCVPPTGADGLCGATFSVRPGTVAVFAGSDGSGIATLLALLLKLRSPDGGQLFIDGRPVESYEMHSYRKCFAYVPKDLQLFPGTIRDNILYGRPDASDGDVERAARAALVDDAVARTPAGYDTTLGEGGHALSAGQARLLVLARAALRDPSILVLHEPFAGLDAESRASVAAAVRRVSGGHTTLVLGEDLCAELDPDVVFHLADGRVVHEELRGTPGRSVGSVS